MEKLSLLEEEMKSLSNIIKSFRVIETRKTTPEDKTVINTALEEAFIEETKEKYDEIILEAEEKAKKIIDTAYTKSEEKLNQAYEEAREILKKAETEGYNQGYDLGKEKGFNEGYDLGYKEGKDDSEKLIKEALDIKNNYIKQKSTLLRDVEEDIIELVISIYEKVLYKRVEEDEDLIVSLVLNGIDNLEISEKLTIIVSKDDYKTVEKSKDIILAKASLIDELDIRINSDMKKGDCILETSKGSVDVSIDDQLSEIKDLLTTILSNE